MASFCLIRIQKVREQKEVSCCVAKLAVRDRVLSAVRRMESAQTGPMKLCPGRGSRGLQLVTDETREEEIALSIAKTKSACDS